MTTKTQSLIDTLTEKVAILSQSCASFEEKAVQGKYTSEKGKRKDLTVIQRLFQNIVKTQMLLALLHNSVRAA